VAQPDGVPPPLARLEVVIGNAIPILGVIVLGWNPVTVVTLYVLDGWFCILGLGASVMLQQREELRGMIPNGYGRLRRFFFWLASVALVEAIVSLFALVPGFMVIGHMARSPGAALVEVFAEAGIWISVAMLVASHVARIARAVRGAGEGVMALEPKIQMALYAGRMALMMSLAWLAAPGVLSRFLVPLYVTGVAALFTYSDLYPRRFLERLGGAPGGSTRSRPGERAGS
jgi:hypothetical protein